MDDDSRTMGRRDVLRAGAAVGAAGVVSGLAGCSNIPNPLSSGGGIGKVPSDAESVFSIDISAAMGDDGVTTLSNAYLDRQSEYDWYQGPTDYEEALDDFEDEAELDPSMSNRAIYFSEYSSYGLSSSYNGSLINGTWDQDEVVDSYEENYPDADDDEYGGKTIYEPANPEFQQALGILGNNWYVMGNIDAVEDVIDVGRGEEDKLDQELRSGFNSTRNAPVRYVGEMGSWMTEGSVPTEDGTLEFDALDDVNHVAGSVYKDGDTRGTENTLVAEDNDAAGEVTDLIEGYISMLESQSYTAESLADVLGDIEVEQNGSDVVLTYEKTIDELEDMMEDSMG